MQFYQNPYYFRLKESVPTQLDVVETEIAANFAAITAYNGPLRLIVTAKLLIEKLDILLSCSSYYYYYYYNKCSGSHFQEI